MKLRGITAQLLTCSEVNFHCDVAAQWKCDNSSVELVSTRGMFLAGCVAHSARTDQLTRNETDRRTRTAQQGLSWKNCAAKTALQTRKKCLLAKDDGGANGSDL